MKRVISFILVLCLLVPLGAISVFADDGKEANVEVSPDILINNDWKDVISETKQLTFYDDNTGIYPVYTAPYEVAEFDMEWKLRGNSVDIKYEYIYNDGTSDNIRVTIEIEEVDGELRLVAEDGCSIYIPADRYDDMCAGIREEIAEEAPVLDLQEFAVMLNDNEAKALTEYNKKLFKANLNANNIKASYFEYLYTYTYGTKGLLVYLPTEVLAELENGEEITVVGVVNIYYPAIYGGFVLKNRDTPE